MEYPKEKPLTPIAKYIEVPEKEPNNKGSLAVELQFYHEGLIPTVHSLALLGLTDKEIATALGVSIECFNIWSVEEAEFFQCLNDGRNMADANVAKALYNRAVGYDYTEERVFVDRETGRLDTVPIKKHLMPDVGAAKTWLQNRRPDQWKESKEVNVIVAPKKKLTDLFDDAEIIEGECSEEK